MADTCGFDGDIFPENKIKLNHFFTEKNEYLILYEYDFGDNWEHFITLKKVIPFDASEEPFKCIGGALACPPEDCGGVYGYYDICSILKKKKKTAADREMLEWLGENYDPNFFSIDEANERLRKLKIKKIKILVKSKAAQSKLKKKIKTKK